MGREGLCAERAGPWGLAERDLNLFIPPSSESEFSSVRKKFETNIEFDH